MRIRPSWVPASIHRKREHTFALRHGVFQWGWTTLGVAALLFLPAVIPLFWLHVVNLALIACIGAISLNLLTGTARLVSLGHAAFLGIGGFTVGLLTLKGSPPVLLVLLAATCAGGLVGAIVAIPSLRLRVLYVAVTTLVLHFGVTLVLNVIQSVLLDSAGMVIAPATILGFELAGPFRWYYVLLALTGLTVVGAANLLRSFVGRRWAAVAEHDLAAESLGISVARAKMSVFVFTSALTAFAGALLAYYVGSVTYEYYSLGLAIAYLAMIIVGGIGRIKGAIMGAFVITAVPYVLEAILGRLGVLSAGSGALAGLQEVAFGLLIVLFLLLEPRGLAELWRRAYIWFANWPFRYRSAERARGTS